MAEVIIGFKELKDAVKRNPRITLQEVGKFLKRGMAEFQRNIRRTPWKVGDGDGSGKGAPKATGQLQQTHQVIQPSNFSIKLVPTAPYAGYVHEGTKKMTARPWLDTAVSDATTELNKLQQDLLKAIVQDLAK